MIIKDHLRFLEKGIYPGQNRMNMLEYSIGNVQWERAICHFYLTSSVSSQQLSCCPIVEERVEDRASKLVGEVLCSETKEWITLVHKCFSKWIDSSLDEMLNKYVDKIYIRMDTSKIPGGVLLGILNCLRGVEEQAHYAFALSYVSEKYPHLTDAQKLIVSTMVHPGEYPLTRFNTNHSVWLPWYVTNLAKLQDFSCLDELVKTSLPFTRNFTWDCRENWVSLKTLRRNMWSSMVPAECFSYSPFARAHGEGSEYTCYSLLLCDGTIEYLLNSNDVTVKGVEKHGKASRPW